MSIYREIKEGGKGRCEIPTDLGIWLAARDHEPPKEWTAKGGEQGAVWMTDSQSWSCVTDCFLITKEGTT